MLLRTLAFVLPLVAVTLVSGEKPRNFLPAAEVIGVRATDVQGLAHILGGSAERNPVVFVFMDVGCPVSNRYVQRLNELAAESAIASVGFFGILSDPSLTVAQAQGHSDDYHIGFPMLVDGSGDLARRLKPTHVPEAFVVSAQDELVYRGRIDDGFAAIGKPRPKVSHHDLADAIAAVVSSKPVVEARTEPVGCLFEAWGEDLRPTEVTYSRDIAPLLNANCVECHRTGEVAPFVLDTYESARRRAKMLALVCEQKIMPPWGATPGEFRFTNERHLSQSELGMLREWADAGAPLGNTEQLLPPPTFGQDGWRLGDPDLVITMPVDYPVPADGADIYRNFVLDVDIEEDKQVIAAEFRPGSAAVVHHAIFYLDNQGRARQLDEADPEPGYSVFGEESPGFWPSGSLGGWAPGAQPYFMPPGYAMGLDADEDFVLEVHYHPNGKATTDRSRLALWFTDEDVREVDSHVIGTTQLDIPPGESHYWRHVWMEVPTAATLFDISPHAHYLGAEFHVEVTYPDGSTSALVTVPRFDFRWQDSYIFAEPIKIPAGSRIDARIRYDNSEENPANPSTPPIQVKEGWQTIDEMCLVYMMLLADDEREERQLMQASYASFYRDATMTD